MKHCTTYRMIVFRPGTTHSAWQDNEKHIAKHAIKIQTQHNICKVYIGDQAQHRAKTKVTAYPDYVYERPGTTQSEPNRHGITQ